MSLKGLEDKKWSFKPVVQTGQKVQGGDVLGEVQETSAVIQKILVPPTINLKSKNTDCIQPVTVIKECLIHAGITHETPHHALLSL